MFGTASAQLDALWNSIKPEFALNMVVPTAFTMEQQNGTAAPSKIDTANIFY
jgi:hypothetical protein